MTQEKLTAFQQVLAKYQANRSEDESMVTALTEIVKLATDGYQSDQKAIAEAVTAQVGDVQAENETLKAEVESLTADSAAKDDTIIELTTKLSEANDSLATALASVTNQDATITGFNGQLAEASSTIDSKDALIAELQAYKDNHPDA